MTDISKITGSNPYRASEMLSPAQSEGEVTTEAQFATLASLPKELKQEISKNLDLASLQSLRQVSRHFQAVSRRNFTGHLVPKFREQADSLRNKTENYRDSANYERERINKDGSRIDIPALTEAQEWVAHMDKRADDFEQKLGVVENKIKTLQSELQPTNKNNKLY